MTPRVTYTISQYRHNTNSQYMDGTHYRWMDDIRHILFSFLVMVYNSDGYILFFLIFVYVIVQYLLMHLKKVKFSSLINLHLSDRTATAHTIA